jgi:hypothetical protein
VVAYHFGLGRDPEVKTNVEQAKLFLSTMQQCPDLAESLDRTCGIDNDRASTAKSVRGRATGPAQSFMAGLNATGWKLHTPTFWEDPDGQHYKMFRGDPLEPFLSTIQHFEERRLWKQASYHQGGKGLEKWPDFGPFEGGDQKAQEGRQLATSRGPRGLGHGSSMASHQEV